MPCEKSHRESLQLGLSSLRQRSRPLEGSNESWVVQCPFCTGCPNHPRERGGRSWKHSSIESSHASVSCSKDGHASNSHFSPSEMHNAWFFPVYSQSSGVHCQSESTISKFLRKKLPHPPFFHLPVTPCWYPLTMPTQHSCPSRPSVSPPLPYFDLSHPSGFIRLTA